MTEFGAAGPITAPISNTECVWYEAELVRMPPRGFVDESTDEDTLWRGIAKHPPVPVDATGSVDMDPALLRRPPNNGDLPITKNVVRKIAGSELDRVPSFIDRQLFDDTRPSERLELREIRLDRGVAVFAIARAGGTRQQPTLVAARGSVNILTSDSAHQVIERRRKAGKESRSMSKWMTIAGVTFIAISAAIFAPIAIKTWVSLR